LFCLLLAGRPDLEFGDKVILPSDEFRTISQLRLAYPLTFGVANERKKASGIPDKSGAVTFAPTQHCGVLEFSAPAEQAYLPFWMMQNLGIREGGRVVLKSVPKVCSGLLRRTACFSISSRVLSLFCVFSVDVAIVLQSVWGLVLWGRMGICTTPHPFTCFALNSVILKKPCSVFVDFCSCQ
jgi:hypothetical protein